MSRSHLSPLRMIRSGLCIGCGSCVARADGSEARMDLDVYGQLRPMGDPTWLSKPTEDLGHICPFSPAAVNEDQLATDLFPSAPKYETVGRFLSAYVGHCESEGFRERGSSGGMVSWVLEELFRKDLIDAAVHVGTSNGSGRLFSMRISRSISEIREGAKSRYYPVDYADALREIKDIPGRYAVVGVPCFIKAIQLLRRQDAVYRERIAYTLGLFCGHMKSARFIESFAQQMDVHMHQVASADFRVKDPNRPASTYTAQFTTREGVEIKRDWWNLAEGDWGAGFFQYKACNYCDDVIAETADISFGDAWVEPYSSDGRGTNVLVIRSPEMEHLIAGGNMDGRLHLSPVDEAFVVATQAAGFRQRQEGLAYRLTWPKRGIRPIKRVSAARPASRQRRLIYASRAMISRWSHRLFYLARSTGAYGFYLRWASAAVVYYQGFAYARGKVGQAARRFKLLDGE